MKPRKPAPAMYQPKVEKQEPTLDLPPCVVCKTAIKRGVYGWHTTEDERVVGTCCGDCERTYNLLERYPSHKW